MTAIYEERLNSYLEQTSELKSKAGKLAWLRLLVLATSISVGVYGFRVNEIGCIITGILALIGFIVIVRIHAHTKRALLVANTFVHINQRELAFLTTGEAQFDDGKEYDTEYHPYSNDLDIVGKGSIYQHLNRTQTVKGGKLLADSLLFKAENNLIVQRQEAIKELNNDLDWRQTFQVHAEIGKDNIKVVRMISEWSVEEKQISKATRTLAYLLPLFGASSMVMLAITNEQKWFTIGILLFISNLVVFASVAKNILAELGDIDRIQDAFRGYSKLLELIEKKDFTSVYLNQQKKNIIAKKITSSSQLKQLSSIFQSLDSVRNGFVMMNLNGTILYHIHWYAKLLKWKKENGAHVDMWTSTIAEFELLVSLSNFSANNPKFAFPSINSNQQITFEGLGHALIHEKKRITNAIDFSNQRFVILTGSNMSGKSTFLRTVGTAMVLSNAGAPVPATSASVHPMDIIVSMRLSDSLGDSESYFFAEVKRLKMIVDELDKRPCFVLLDEILRGTNSDDKRSGTIAVVEKLVAKKAIGMIATHDLEVCDTTIKYPEYLSNKCFEVEIINDDLVFDYSLRDGICKNKSATFIMTKMRII